MEALKANDLDWLKELLGREDYDVSDAVIYSARTGKTEAVKLLLPHMYESWGYDLKEGMWETLEKAVVAASDHVQLDVVNLLLPKNNEDDGVAWEVIATAAEKGHIDLLKLATQIVDSVFGSREKGDRVSVLRRAIVAGQTAAATYLVNRYYREWSFEEALEIALGYNLSAVAECIYAVVAEKEGYHEFFVRLAGFGHIKALKFLYNRGIDSPEFVSNAFVSAGSVRVLSMLLNTDKVSDQAFKRAFWYASRNRRTETALFFCASKRVSAEAIKFAFESAGDLAMSKLLYGKLQDPTEATVTAFRNATFSGRRYIYTLMLPADRIAVVRFLVSTGHVPVELIVEAFLSCRGEVVKALLNEPCISVEIVHKAFQNAVASGRTEVVELLAHKVHLPAGR
ncbi:hypothetical protein ON010_g15463 [Phytophthora cinnamomi]|nr:hypothetical protein ON010_g15463 [Phytophthora cinnamomi]